MSGIVLTGSAGALGRRVAARLAASAALGPVIGIDVVAAPGGSLPGVTEHQVDLICDDLGPYFEGAEVIVHLASVFAPERAGVDADFDAQLTCRVLDAAAACGARGVVLMSSATVYGAWPHNPVPLTEDAPLDPNPGFAFAQGKLECEQLAADFARAHLDVSVAVLRPTTTMAEDTSSWVSSALASAAGVRAGEIDPPVQFLHFDDLASATVLVAERGGRGAFNVAPDAWISPDAMRALAGMPRPRVPVFVAGQLAAWRWRVGLSNTPPEILPWTMYPWVVSNDRLRAEGWVPTHTNEEAYVVGTIPGPFETLSPKRRQELALGVAGALVAGAGVAGAALLRRARRR